MGKVFRGVPSLLSADFTRIAEAVDLAERAKAEWVHLDVMDGSFVPPITFGAQLVKDIRKRTSLTLDVHLMIRNPERHITVFAEAGADYITFHPEATIHSHRVLGEIKARGKKAGISLVPSTPVSQIEPLLPFVDLVLVMTVNPGYAGQHMIRSCLEKVRALDKLRRKDSLEYLLSVDGGVDLETIVAVRKSGADCFVVGTSFYSAENPEWAMKKLLS